MKGSVEDEAREPGGVRAFEIYPQRNEYQGCAVGRGPGQKQARPLAAAQTGGGLGTWAGRELPQFK